MLSFQQCLTAHSPLTFVVTNSDIELLHYLHSQKREDSESDYFVYNPTFAKTMPLNDLFPDQPPKPAKPLPHFKCVNALGVSRAELLTQIYHVDVPKGSRIFQKYILLEADSYIDDTQTVRRIKDILTRYQCDPDYMVSLIVVCQNVCVPAGLERLADLTYFDLPSMEQLRALSQKITTRLKLSKDKGPTEEVVNNLRGLTLFETE